MKRLGRPPKMTPERIKLMADCFLCAMTDAQTAVLCQVDERTIRRIRAGGFCPEVKETELKRELMYRRRLWTSQKLYAGICWMLERKYPGQLAKPELQLAINNNLNITNQTLVITAAGASDNLARVKPIAEKIDQLLHDKRGNGNHLPEAKPNGNGSAT